MRARLDWVLVGLLSVSALGNVYLLGQRSAQSSAPNPAKPKVAESGQVLPAFAGQSIDGKTVALSFSDDRPTLVYVFSPTCVWCDRNADSIKALIAQASGRVSINAISLTPVTNAAALEKGVPPELVVVGITPQVLQQARLGVTPLTLLVEKGGKIKRVWSGAYSDAVKAEISEELGVNLSASKGKQ